MALGVDLDRGDADDHEARDTEAEREPAHQPRHGSRGGGINAGWSGSSSTASSSSRLAHLTQIGGDTHPARTLRLGLDRADAGLAYVVEQFGVHGLLSFARANTIFCRKIHALH